MPLPQHRHPEDWIAEVFAARAVRKGGVIRRSVAWVEHEIGRDRFLAEVRARGFHLWECNGQFIVICSPAPMRRLI